MGPFETGFGSKVLGLGDVDGDGKGDVLVKTRGRTQSDIHVLSAIDGRAIYSLPGVAPGWEEDEFNESVGVIGDIDNDGARDFAVSAVITPEVLAERRPILSLYSGRTGKLLRQHLPEDCHAKVRKNTGDLRVMTQLGDIDGDGMPDYGVNEYQGLVCGHLFSGRSGALLTEFTKDSNNSFLRYGVVGAGDQNGDGIADIAIFNHDTTSGGVRLFSGAQLDREVDFGLTFPPFLWSILRPEGPNIGWGKGVTPIGDVTGGGKNDFLVGIDGGVAFVSGERRESTWVWSAGAEYRAFGGVASAIGDVNGDDITDIAVGVHRIFGGEEGFLVVLSGQDGTLLGKLSSPGGRDRFGASLSGIGDITGDGVSEVAVGAVSRINSLHPGYVYIIAVNTPAARPIPEQMGASIQQDRHGRVILTWEIIEGHRPRLETSSDLVSWESLNLGEARGFYASDTRRNSDQGFFRIIHE